MPDWDRILLTPTSTMSCNTKSLASVRRAAAETDRHRRRTSELARQRGARSAGVRQAAMRQVPRHRRTRRRSGRDHVRRRLADAAARGGSHGAVDVPWRRHVARHLPAVPYRHDRHADAVIRGRGERRGDVGPRQLRRLTRAQASLVDDHRGGRTVLRAPGGAGESRAGEAGRSARGHTRVRAVPFASRSEKRVLPE